MNILNYGIGRTDARQLGHSVCLYLNVAILKHDLQNRWTQRGNTLNLFPTILLSMQIVQVSSLPRIGSPLASVSEYTSNCISLYYSRVSVRRLSLPKPYLSSLSWYVIPSSSNCGT